MEGTFSFTATVPPGGTGHVDVTVRAGKPGQRALLGVLRMRPEEWREFFTLVERADGGQPGEA